MHCNNFSLLTASYVNQPFKQNGIDGVSYYETKMVVEKKEIKETFNQKSMIDENAYLYEHTISRSKISSKYCLESNY